MKKLLFAVVTLVGFSIASFAQTSPAAKKAEPSKIQPVKKITDKKVEEKATTISKANKTAVATDTKAVTAKPVAKTNGAVPLKKDGTPDKRFKSSKSTAAGPLKKDGTADLRYKANKKHS